MQGCEVADQQDKILHALHKKKLELKGSNTISRELVKTWNMVNICYHYQLSVALSVLFCKAGKGANQHDETFHAFHK